MCVYKKEECVCVCVLCVLTNNARLVLGSTWTPSWDWMLAIRVNREYMVFLETPTWHSHSFRESQTGWHPTDAIRPHTLTASASSCFT